MPFTFPSHPGLILPLWVRWPKRFDAWSLTVGAVLPDLVDVFLEIPTGALGQNFAHSIAGVVTVVVPMGFVLVYVGDSWMTRRFGRYGPGTTAGRITWRDRLRPERFVWRRVLCSVAVGAFSHILFDALTHDQLDWLLPWRRVWYSVPPALAGQWFRVWLRGMESSVGVRLFGFLWLVLSGLGAVLFLACGYVAGKRRTWR